MTRITFIGDIMLGRMIGAKYTQSPYELVDERLQAVCKASDLTIANLESTVTITKPDNADHLQFVGSEAPLKELKWIDLFSLANNHINDASEVGMDETMMLLERNGYRHNGLFSKFAEYEPYTYVNNGNNIVIVTVTDMLNLPFMGGVNGGVYEWASKWSTMSSVVRKQWAGW